MRICNVAQPADLLMFWHTLAEEKYGTPVCIYLQIACNTMVKRLGLESPVITYHIDNMVCDIVFAAHDRANLLIGYLPFLFLTLTATKAQSLFDNICVWDTRKLTVTETSQASHLARLLSLLSFVNVCAML